MFKKKTDFTVCYVLLYTLWIIFYKTIRSVQYKNDMNLSLLVQVKDFVEAGAKEALTPSDVIAECDITFR